MFLIIHRYPGSGSYRGGSGGFGGGGFNNKSKFGYNNRKISTDSGISAVSSVSTVGTFDSEMDMEVRAFEQIVVQCPMVLLLQNLIKDSTLFVFSVNG